MTSTSASINPAISTTWTSVMTSVTSGKSRKGTEWGAKRAFVALTPSVPRSEAERQPTDYYWCVPSPYKGHTSHVPLVATPCCEGCQG